MLNRLFFRCPSKTFYFRHVFSAGFSTDLEMFLLFSLFQLENCSHLSHGRIIGGWQSQLIQPCPGIIHRIRISSVFPVRQGSQSSRGVCRGRESSCCICYLGFCCKTGTPPEYNSMNYGSESLCRLQWNNAHQFRHRDISNIILVYV